MFASERSLRGLQTRQPGEFLQSRCARLKLPAENGQLDAKGMTPCDCALDEQGPGPLGKTSMKEADLLVLVPVTK